jgi:uncharacterized protein DUF1552
MRRTRRQFIRDLGLSAAAIPFVLNLPGMAFANQEKRKQRIIFMFSPNGVVRKNFWPDQEGPDFVLKEILEPLKPYQDNLLVLNGLCDKLRGDGDSHMRGMGCLLTGIELFPGNIQGGGDTPAGWSKGISIDQELKNFLQKDESTRTRFGSLEFGVMVPERADTWTRWSYTGPNKPVAPIDDPQQMFAKLYGRAKDQAVLKSVLDDVTDDLKRASAAVGSEDRRLIDEHATFVREMEEELKQSKDAMAHPVPVVEPGVRKDNDHIPQISKTQIDLIVNSFAVDFTRVASLQYTNSVGNARMRWLGIDDAHHALSHEPNDKLAAQEKLAKIDRWFAEQVAYMTRRLAETPEPGGSGSLLDNTLIVWTNELGEGNTHSLDNIPFVLLGGGLDFKMGRSLKFDRTPHNRLLMALAHGFGHNVETFGNPNFCAAGPLRLT